MPRKPKVENPPEADLGRKIREAEFKNILAKLREGKTLSAREAKIAEEFAHERDGKPRQLTQREVAAAWGMTQPNVAYMVKQGMPMDSLESAMEWRKKYLEEKGRGENAPASYQEARTRKALLECERLEQQLAILRGEYVKRSDVVEDGVRIGAIITAKVAALVNDSCGALAGLAEAELRSKLHDRTQVMLAEIKEELARAE
jgi:predicted XRE-type DNA-binding protein